MVTTDALGDGTFELGYWLSSEEHPPSALIRHAEMAEASGFTTAMISDHLAPWVPEQGQSGFVWSVLGGIAATTRELRVGTGVSAPIHRMHPLVLAHAAATTETLMPGRFFLGLGTGERLNEAAMGQRWPRPGERRSMLREAVDVIRELWSGEVVTRADGPFTLERAQLFSLPDVPPPIVLAASGPRGARLAAEVGDGLLSASPDPSLVDAFEAAGGRDKQRMVQLHVCWAANDDDARRTVRRWWPNGGVPGSLLAELARPADFEDLATALDEAAIQDAVISGPDPEPYVAAIDRAVGAGFRTVYLHQLGPDQESFFEFARRELRPACTR
jgi:coenzyme F420-dependent glucose-6-phosphate dehydrogenase